MSIAAVLALFRTAWTHRPPTRQRREKVVLFVGAIQKRKNVARLVRAFERMPRGWTLILRGRTRRLWRV